MSGKGNEAYEKLDREIGAKYGHLYQRMAPNQSPPEFKPAAEPRVSASMAEGIAEVLRDHRVLWETTHDDDVMLARCKSCGYLVTELETWEHQANVASEVLAANGYGTVREARAAALEDAADVLARSTVRDPLGKATFENYAEWLRARAVTERGGE